MNYSPLILIVDDNEYNVILLSEILKNNGNRVISAKNGRECIEVLEHETPDIILLDVFMPELNGFETAQKIKNDERLNSIPIIFLSADSGYNAKLKGFDSGAIDYITKPYDDREVLARIKIHLKIKELEKEKIAHIQKLEEVNREKDNLLEMIAHDMRSPLTSIMLMSELLIETKKEINNEKLHKYSLTIFNSSKKILKLINQLLQNRKAESTKPKLIEFDLSKAITHCTDLVKTMIEKKSIQLELKLFAPSIIVNLDEEKIDQIFNNILYNSIKFTNANGLILVIIEIISKDNANVLHVSIKDNGIGIPTEILKRIFSKNGDIHREGTSGEEGTGLGLSITKNLITSLNGKIEIESEVDLGTTVHLYFYSF